MKLFLLFLLLSSISLKSQILVSYEHEMCVKETQEDTCIDYSLSKSKVIITIDETNNTFIFNYIGSIISHKILNVEKVKGFEIYYYFCVDINNIDVTHIFDKTKKTVLTTYRSFNDDIILYEFKLKDL